MSPVFLRVGLIIASGIATQAAPGIAAIIIRLITNYETKRKKRRRIRRRK